MIICPKCGNRDFKKISKVSESVSSDLYFGYECLLCDDLFFEDACKDVLINCRLAEEVLNHAILKMIDWCNEKKFRTDEEAQLYFQKRSPAEKKNICIEDYYNIKRIKVSPDSFNPIASNDTVYFYKFLKICTILALVNNFSTKINREFAISYINECGYSHLLKVKS